MIKITTLEQAEAMRITRQYPLADLPRGDYDGLVDAIQSCIAPTTWDQVGGPGSISVFMVGNVPPSLVVSQTPEVHGQISALLAELRTAVQGSVGRRP